MIEITLTVNTDGDEKLTSAEMQVEFAKRAHQTLTDTLGAAFDGDAYRTLNSVKDTAELFGTTKKTINTILQEEGWQVKIDDLWIPTPKGQKLGGACSVGRKIFWNHDAIQRLMFSECDGDCARCS